MALRRMAAGVEDALTGYMHEHRIEEIWPASERVLVVVDADPGAGVVLRNAWRLASALRGELVAVAAVPAGGLAARPEAERRAIEKNLTLAEDLGARTRLLETGSGAEDPAAMLAKAVRDEHATLVVMRYQRPTGWQRLRGASFVDGLMARLENVDVHLVETTGGRR
jgi:K+-sensing histidine kinase KdpD